jgi:putative salt-induced outer membrane protein YdiY
MILSSSAPVLAWDPPSSLKDDSDWLRLDSGEWLQGEFRGYRDDELFFDSAGLNMQTLDLGDVSFLRTVSPVQLGFETRKGGGFLSRGLEEARGRIEIQDGEVRLQPSGRVLTRTEDVVSIVSAEQGEWDLWSAKASLGSNFREGNVNQIDYSLRLEVERLTTRSRFALNYLGNYGESEGVEFANNHRTDFNWDLYQTSDFFLRPVGGEYFRDPFQNIDHRVILGSGLGYEVINTPDLSWELSAGPAFQLLRFSSVPAGMDNGEESLAGFFSSRFEKKINDHVDFVSVYRAVVTSREAGLYSHHFLNSLSFDLTGDLDFDVSLAWDRVQEPARQNGGETPKPDDFRLMLMLGLEF